MSLWYFHDTATNRRTGPLEGDDADKLAALLDNVVDLRSYAEQLEAALECYEKSLTD